MPEPVPNREDRGEAALPTTDGDRPYRVGFLLFEGFALIAFASLCEPLRAANLIAGRTLYHPRSVPAAGAQTRSSSGTIVPADAQVGEGVDYDLVLVVAEAEPSPVETRLVTPWLRALSRRGVRLGGVGAGPVVLARAGLMEGRRMAVDPAHANGIAAASPDIAVESATHVIDGDRLTSAGGMAPAAMIDALLVERHGEALARAVRAWLRPALGLSNERGAVRHPALVAALAAMEGALAEPLAEPLDLAALAERAGVGARQLNRLFHEALGISAMAHYRALRLDRAASLLERSGMSVTQIALATGFQNFSHFATAFRGHAGCSPRAWRARSREGAVYASSSTSQ